MSTPTPSSDVCVTTRTCAACARQLPTGRSRRFCSPACRQAAYRRRHQPPHDERAVPLPRTRSRLEGTVYQCPDCESRYLAEQWCPECARPCHRLGAGGICPCCQEMITIAELTETISTSRQLPVPSKPVHH